MAIAFQSNAFQESAFQEGQVTSIIVIVTGVQATGSIGTVVVTGTATVLLTGVVAFGQIGSTPVWGLVPTNPATTWTLITN